MDKKTTGFFEQVYAVVAAIPKGKVMTYGQIARLLGGYYSGRTVGFAMRAAPGDRELPCHRVINKQGDMAPGFCFGGADNQRRLLKREGVRFYADGRVNLAKSRHEFPVDFLPPPLIRPGTGRPIPRRTKGRAGRDSV